jgi:hypothetical protein
MQERGLAEQIIGHVLGFTSTAGGGGTRGAAAGEAPDDLWYWAVLKTLRADMRSDKLYPPGEVYWMNAGCPVSAAPAHVLPLTLHCIEEVELAYSEIMFSKTMFYDHLVPNYLHCLHQLHLQAGARGAAEH